MAMAHYTKGAVLELGCGDYSTPALHFLCHDRLLVSAESNAQWLSRFEDLRSFNHQLHLVEAWADFKLIDERFWDLAFIDHGPAERRRHDIARLAGRAKYIVIHDTEDPGYHYESVLSTFKYRFDYKKYRPWTTVVSQFEPIPACVTSEPDVWFDGEQKVLPVYINNRNRLSSIVKLTAWLEQLPYVKIFILDNDSTYPPLLRWYSETPHTVLKLGANLGHCALWVHNRFSEDGLQLQFQQEGDWYVYTDSDIVPREDCPLDALQAFKRLMEEHPDIYKVGFGLEILDLPDHYPLRERVINWENQFWREGVGPRAFRAGVDTTFALYHKGRGVRHIPDLPPPHQGHQIHPSLRTNYPYVARHLPWYVDPSHLDEEERYYMDHAGPVATWAKALLNATKTG